MQDIGRDCLAALDPDSDDFVENAALLAEAMIPVNTGSKEPHWDESARALLTACFMFAQIHPERE
jgi:type IV secretory pathway TraG/TraD family ATPase VirD4